MVEELWKDPAWLALALRDGRSIESIAREFGRSPSTIGHWARKHGLTSMHASKNAPRGGIDRAVLTEHVEHGLSVREIAALLRVSESTVRHHLKRAGLATKRAARSRLQREHAICPVHGPATFVLRPDGYRRCIKCRSEAVSRRRRKVKATLVAEAGGACVLCGYDRYVGALQFHHRDRDAKSFPVSRAGVTMAIGTARSEVAKCVLLCANCHAEVEAGIATIQGSDRGSVPVSCDPE